MKAEYFMNQCSFLQARKLKSGKTTHSGMSIWMHAVLKKRLKWNTNAHMDSIPTKKTFFPRKFHLLWLRWTFRKFQGENCKPKLEICHFRFVQRDRHFTTPLMEKLAVSLAITAANTSVLMSLGVVWGDFYNDELKHSIKCHWSHKSIDWNCFLTMIPNGE